MCRPQLPVRREPRVELGERFGPDAIQAALSVGTYVDETGFFQDAEVLRHRRLAERQLHHQLTDRSLAAAQQVEDRYSLRLGEHLEDGHPHGFIFVNGYISVKT